MYSPFHLSEVHHVVNGAGLTHHVEPPQACVCVAGVKGLKAVAQVSLTGHLSQFTGQVLGSQRTKSSTDVRTLKQDLFCTSLFYKECCLYMLKKKLKSENLS